MLILYIKYFVVNADAVIGITIVVLYNTTMYCMMSINCDSNRKINH